MHHITTFYSMDQRFYTVHSVPYYDVSNQKNKTCCSKTFYNYSLVSEIRLKIARNTFIVLWSSCFLLFLIIDIL